MVEAHVKRNRTTRGRMSFEAGHAAEDRVAETYAQRGMTVLERRWRGTLGEIDLVVRDGARLIFVEVKHSRTFDAALGHLRRSQIARLYQTVDEFLASEPKGNLTDVRFDVALVNEKGEARIMENAFA